MGKYSNYDGPKIPKAREALIELAVTCGNKAVAKEIHEIVHDLMYRSAPAKPVARAKANTITPELVALIYNFAKANPTMSNRAVGRHFNVDGGRVSEIINGKRTVADPTMSRLKP